MKLAPTHSRLLCTALMALPLAGCFNLPTSSSDISGTYVSDVKYAKYDCEALAAETASLAKREGELVTAQDGRRTGSKVQAFFLGFGRGDGLEAVELANVRGEKEAVRQAMDKLACQ